VLAISLIVLAVLTILGVAALNTSALQSTMANNFQFQIGAMENAEVSVGIGEDIAVDIVDTGDIGFELFDTANNEFQLGGTVDPTDLDWTASGYSPRATANGEYVVEYVGIIPLGTGNDVAVGVGEIISGNMGHFFIVSARSKTNKGATRTLQTTLVTLVP
jgi:hypothetical protein